MRKIMMILLTASLLFVGIGLCDQVVQAEERSTTIQVSYEPETSADFHTLTLSVSGGGRVLDGTQIIKEGVLTYDLQEGAEKTFLLEPYKGYRLRSVTYKGDGKSQDFTDKMRDQSLSVRMGRTDSSLSVVFEKTAIQQEKGDGRLDGSVKTGDTSDIQTYLVLMTAAFAVCAGIYEFKRRRVEKS